jgi:hypothetical protein
MEKDLCFVGTVAEIFQIGNPVLTVARIGWSLHRPKEEPKHIPAVIQPKRGAGWRKPFWVIVAVPVFGLIVVLLSEPKYVEIKL